MTGCYPILIASYPCLPMRRDPCKDRRTDWKRADRLISVDDVDATEVDDAPVDSIDLTDSACEKSSDEAAGAA